MKNYFYRILPYGCIGIFLLYWAGIIMIAMPVNKVKVAFINKIPRFNSMFGNSWKLFTPPHTYNTRLYYVVRDINKPGKTDTIEVLEPISLQKQSRAPFNQQENIIDHLVNNNMSRMIRIVWSKNKIPTEAMPGMQDSAYIAGAIAAVANNKKYIMYLAMLNKYGTLALKEKKIDLAGKELKIVIRKKMIRPFKDLDDPQFLPKEILIFETPFTPVHP